MNIAILGTGDVGRSLAEGFARAGHRVTIGGRSAENDEVERHFRDRNLSDAVQYRDFPSAAEGCEIAVLCVAGAHALSVADAVRTAVRDKILIDVTNPLEFPDGKTLRLSVANDDSLSEQIQRTLPDTRVVKALNTVNSHIMTHPRELGENHLMFVAGDDEEARTVVRNLLVESLGWSDVVDLGALTAARAMESYLHLWLQLWRSNGHARFNIALVSAPPP